MKRKGILVSIVMCSLFVVLLLLYIFPNVLGHLFIDIRVFQILYCNKLHGFAFEIRNSYFLPVVLSYPGSDAIVDLFADNNSKIHRATFLSEELHDDEEGFIHITQLAPALSRLNLSLYESTQYYQTSKIPNLQNDLKYRISANIFGINAKPVYDRYVYQDVQTESSFC